MLVRIFYDVPLEWMEWMIVVEMLMIVQQMYRKQ